MSSATEQNNVNKVAASPLFFRHATIKQGNVLLRLHEYRDIDSNRIETVAATVLCGRRGLRVLSNALLDTLRIWCRRSCPTSRSALLVAIICPLSQCYTSRVWSVIADAKWTTSENNDHTDQQNQQQSVHTSHGITSLRVHSP